ncbi:RNA 2'-phosphotransferase [Actinotalea ferrariae CF5-4]|uniref:Probable RNA 2'-phosphotransferase n=1 Tax=Actinotalea ferrariae CF5-4 TaxID=948458 RepID=A0A021VU66_9CELL|nr:RNA 2'-phosphotransferase [Actinotalea ferrariae]EYR62612.1 RNA 2'-phosphotransferase [Actinotalea ferrariae CF5-4]
MDLVRTSRRISRVLRHAPQPVGLTLDRAGWVSVGDLLDALARHGTTVTRDELEQVVAGNDKQRFELDLTSDRIRARQGHSVPVDLDLDPAVPPAVLFHGTPKGNVAAITREGLVRGARHHVHLSPDRQTAQRVGERRGRAAVLEVDAAGMTREGFVFFVTGNGVWLTDAVPPRFVSVPSER